MDSTNLTNRTNLGRRGKKPRNTRNTRTNFEEVEESSFLKLLFHSSDSWCPPVSMGCKPGGKSLFPRHDSGQALRLATVGDVDRDPGVDGVFHRLELRGHAADRKAAALVLGKAKH